MANWKKVDADQLDADLTSVADSIRNTGATDATLSFPSDFKNEVDHILDFLIKLISRYSDDYTGVFFQKV